MYNESFTDMVQPIADFIVWWESLINHEKSSAEALYDYNRVLGETTKGHRELAIVATERSTWPDIEAATIAVTRKTIEYTDTLSRLSGHTKNLYLTSADTWSNIRREITGTSQLWEKSDKEALDRNADIQFSLYQTADAVVSLGTAYQDTGEKAERAAWKMVDALNLFKDALVLPNVALESVTQATQGNAAAFQSIGNFGNLSSDQLRSLGRSTQLFTPQGLIGVNQLARQNQVPLSQQTVNPAATGGQPLTIIIEGSETAKLAGVIRAEERDYKNRSVQSLSSLSRGVS